MTRVDLHQHLWTAPLLEALAARRRHPFVRRERGVPTLHLAGERPYAIDPAGEHPDRRVRLLLDDGVERALVALSSPLGIEALPRAEAAPLLEAYHAGVAALPDAFGFWGAVALDEPDPDEVDAALARGAVGVSLPAGALASVQGLPRVGGLLERLEQREAPLLVHPGPAPWSAPREQAGLCDPLWWPALTAYVAELQAAWLAFSAVGRREHPRLRIVFTALAGGAPLLAERLGARGGRIEERPDPLIYYESSSFGPRALAALAALVGPEQLLYGSDRPVVDPGPPDAERAALATRGGRLLGLAAVPV